MSTKITTEEVAHVALLARLSISDEEAELYAAQLSSVLGHASDIEALELGETPPTSHPLPLVNVFREDIPTRSLERSSFLSQAPSVLQEMFLVPAILSEAP